MSQKIAVAIPCYNEEAAISKVIHDFREVLPDASIHVFDNNSTDKSVQLAKEANVQVHHVYRQGKGFVVQAIFDTIDADALIMVDGDDTYLATDALTLLEPILEGKADMVVGNRLKHANSKSLSKLRNIGNRLICKTINFVFNTSYKDILSGYRVMSKRLVKSTPLLTSGFETETELTLQALEENLTVLEIPISYQARSEDSSSKLRPFRDGFRILFLMGSLLRDHRPLRFYGPLGIFCIFCSLLAGTLKFMNYIGLTEISNALLTGFILLILPLGLLFFTIGLILSAVNTRLRELKQIIRRNP